MDSVVQLYNEKEGRGTPNERECVKTIIELTSHYPLTTIVVDGIDEFETIDLRRSLIKCFQKILNESKSLVKILVSSRNLRDIETEMNTDESLLQAFEILKTDNEGDIRRFIEKQLENYIQTKDLLDGDVPLALQQQITTKLMGGSQGM